ncbi:GroES-like protein [Gloeophyllum trabeum ATCC 11539]|uniref:GroES-like protein n=1 Tax=Gloeophyllum trabeum (strain ATCC 11539 / FP-39264 / Madison 617) TaxID=670483 RepID=S7RFH7_GLOTA|nr:GroES-like protein [Gloeophyllum trabeum ATCC 11539]EPQ52945.1 GroES-like protein [Gloeophyllum trabeum ATCC 11539]
MSHKAIIFPALGAKLEVISVPTPALRDDHVQVAPDYVSPAPIDVWQGHHGIFATFPVIPCGSLVGTIIAAGSEVTHVKKGDRIVANVFGPQEQKAAQAIVTIPGNRVGKLPKNVDSVAAVTSLGLVPVFHSVTSKSNGLGLRLRTGLPNEDFPPLSAEEQGKRILIWGGSSATGQFAVQMLAFTGYRNIIATASPKHHDYIRSLGASKAVDYNSPEFAREIGEVDLVLDFVANRKETIPRIAKVVRNDPASKVAIFVPIKSGGRSASNLGVELEKDALPNKVQVILVTSHIYEQNPFLKSHLQTEIVPGLLGQGAVKPLRAKVIEGSSSVEALNKAVALLKDGVVSGEKLVVDVMDLQN